MLGDRAAYATQILVYLFAQFVVGPFLEELIKNESEKRQVGRRRIVHNMARKIVRNSQTRAIGRLNNHVVHHERLDPSQRVMALAAKYLQHVGMPMAKLEMVATHRSYDPELFFLSRTVQHRQELVRLLDTRSREQLFHLIKEQDNSFPVRSVCDNRSKM